MKHLGEYLDIHCGGVDNIFPHHTNEIAQSESYLGHKWCNYWFHVQHLNDKSGKMDGEPDLTAAASYQDAFAEAMGSDINTSQALTVLYDVLKADISDATKRYLVEDFDKVFSLDLTVEEEENQADDALAAFVEEKIAERQAARKEKDFAKADAIRQELLDKGIAIKDTREGTVWSLV